VTARTIQMCAGLNQVQGCGVRSLIIQLQGISIIRLRLWLSAVLFT